MGGKRKRQEGVGNSRLKRRRRILSSSSDSSLNESPNREAIEADSSPRSSVYRMGQDMAHVMPMISPLPATPPAAMTPLCSAETEELDSDILKLLGDALKPNTCFGKSIHKDVAGRWQNILEKGLPKDIKEKLLNEYMVPDNCKMLVAPILNPEAKAALTDITVKRDHSLMDKQKQIGVALSALSRAIDEINSIENKEYKLKILKPVSDACRILCEVHNSDTKLRRNFVISAVNSNLKETLMESGRDDYLFGTNLAERLKAAKTIQQSGESLRQKFNKNNFISKPNYRTRLNSRGLHREQKVTYRADAGRARGPPRQPPPAPAPAPRSYRAPRAAPPPSPPPQRRTRRHY